MNDECERFEELISAEVDGELGPDEGRQLRRHLESCASCQAFAAAIGGTSIPTPQRFERNRWIRAGLFASGVALVAGRVPDVLSSASGTEVHIARHQAAFVVALGLVFVYTAWRPDRAYGLLPLTLALGVVLVLAVVIDLASGNTALALESGHVLELVGLALAGWLAWEVGPGKPSRPRSRDVPLRKVE